MSVDWTSKEPINGKRGGISFECVNSYLRRLEQAERTTYLSNIGVVVVRRIIASLCTQLGREGKDANSAWGQSLKEGP